jgi:hypothetical protein
MKERVYDDIHMIVTLDVVQTNVPLHIRLVCEVVGWFGEVRSRGEVR